MKIPWCVVGSSRNKEVRMMYTKIICAIASVFIIVPAALSWEYVATFDTNENWKYFDNDTGAGTAAPQGTGILSVPYSNYGAPSWSWRYIFVDQDAANFSPNMNLTNGFVRATLSYSGSVAPTFAYFFLAGGGNTGDDTIYVGGGQGGSQTFWGAYNKPLSISQSPNWTTAAIDFNTTNFGVFDVGPAHDARRGTPDSWDTTITTVDAVGVVLGYYGTPPGDAKLNIDTFTVTPEPSMLLLSGPLAGFLGWKIRRRGRRPTSKV
jgi:hypothetical protein